MDMKAYANLRFENVVYFKLQEAERKADLTDQRYSSQDVITAMRDAIEKG